MAHQFNANIDRMATTGLRTIWHKVEHTTQTTHTTHTEVRP